jgi:DNA-binding MarR family transcriptional regulator
MRKSSDAERLYLFVQHMSRRMRDLNAGQGLTTARFSVLVELAFHGVNNIGQLAAHEGVSRPAMTRLIRDMERAGQVKRNPDKVDGRGVVVAITPKGKSLVERVRQTKIAVFSRYLNELDHLAGQKLRDAIPLLEDLERR